MTNCGSSAVAQGLRGEKGEAGSPGLPGFSGPKGPAVSGRGRAVDLKIIAKHQCEHSFAFGLQGPPGPAGPEGKQVRAGQDQWSPMVPVGRCVLISYAAWFHREFRVELEIVDSKAIRWGPKQAPPKHGLDYYTSLIIVTGKNQVGITCWLAGGCQLVQKWKCGDLLSGLCHWWIISVLTSGRSRYKGR